MDETSWCSTIHYGGIDLTWFIPLCAWIFLIFRCSMGSSIPVIGESDWLAGNGVKDVTLSRLSGALSVMEFGDVGATLIVKYRK